MRLCAAAPAARAARVHVAHDAAPARRAAAGQPLVAAVAQQSICEQLALQHLRAAGARGAAAPTPARPAWHLRWGFPPLAPLHPACAARARPSPDSPAVGCDSTRVRAATPPQVDELFAPYGEVISLRLVRASRMGPSTKTFAFVKYANVQVKGESAATRAGPLARGFEGPAGRTIRWLSGRPAARRARARPHSRGAGGQVRAGGDRQSPGNGDARGRRTRGRACIFPHPRVQTPGPTAGPTRCPLDPPAPKPLPPLVPAASRGGHTGVKPLALRRRRGGRRWAAGGQGVAPSPPARAPLAPLLTRPLT
jgi:hypothetical protein